MKMISNKQVIILDSYLKNAQKKLIDYLLELDSKKFLYEFYKVAGLEPLTDEGYQGWERSDAVNFRGHFFGHYMSALSSAYHSESEIKIKELIFTKIKEAIEGLYCAQKNYSKLHPESAGYVSAFREVALDEVEGKEISFDEKENVLVPWYNLHKILAGLIDVHNSIIEVDSELASKALFVASSFGDYIYNRMIQLDNKDFMLRVEYGGMNDALYSLFELTGKKKHRIAATYFDEDELFIQIARGEDVLSGKHANTQIPKFIGAAHRYKALTNDKVYPTLTKEEQDSLDMYCLAAKSFWDIVVYHHTYCTGGNSQSEHFHKSDDLYHDAEVLEGDCTCETCNAHNMLKLTSLLYELTGEVKYLNFYEKTYINSILASQNPETGMMMYFQPMGSGYNKVYNEPFTNFWCCTGTGIESFSKLSNMFYVKDKHHVLINLYFSNVLSLDDKNLKVIQRTDRTTMTSEFKITKINIEEESKNIELLLRIPEWCNIFSVFINGIEQTVTNENGFIRLNKAVGDGDSVKTQFVPTLKMTHAPDNKNYVAFEYGPYVLSANLGDSNMSLSNPNGILVRVGAKDLSVDDKIIYSDDDFLDNVQTKFKKIHIKNKTVAFHLLDSKNDLIFTPYYEQYNQRYGIYFNLVKEGSNFNSIDRSSNVIDKLINFDDNNSEYAKNLKYYRSEVGSFQGRRYRQLLKDGWFQYVFSTKNENKLILELCFCNEDCGLEFLLISDNFEQRIQIEENGNSFFSMKIELDTIKNPFVQLKFEAIERDEPRLFGILVKKRN